ncbi:MAG: flagellar protein FlaG [Thermodesulfobacteriota bacterium]
MDPVVKISPFLPPLKRAAPGETQPPRPAREQKKKESDPQQTLDHVSGLIQEHIGGTDFRLNFSIDQDTKTVVVKVIDGKTGKIIREIPPSELLALAKSMKESEGFLFNENI